MKGGIKEMKYIKFILVPLLFVSLAFMNIGGCGGSDGNNNDTVQPTNPPPTATPPTAPPATPAPPTAPPATPPPPTDPPPTSGACQIPALDTDFSTEGYFFFDPFTGFTIGVTSTGEDVVIVIIDSVGDSVGAGAFPISAFACIIDVGIIGEATFAASGLCGRSDDATLFLIADFFIGSVEIVNATLGECFAVRPLGTSSVSLESALESDLESIAIRLHNEMIENTQLETEPFSLENFSNALRELE